MGALREEARHGHLVEALPVAGERQFGRPADQHRARQQLPAGPFVEVPEHPVAGEEPEVRAALLDEGAGGRDQLGARTRGRAPPGR